MRFWEAGASIVAVHARRPDDGATCDPDIYADINERIRARCDIVINNSTSGGISGDMYIGNDPYVGALHQNDVQMAGPVFDGDRLVAWAGVMAHETGVGGMNFASWRPQATEVCQECLRIPAVKLVDASELRDDVLEMIVGASRLPAALGLDIRAFIATLNVATERLHGLFARYSSDVVAEVMRRMIDTTEVHARARLAELPDGQVHVRDFLEPDGHQNRLYAVDLVATKQGDRLTPDFGGSIPQAPGFINATRAGLRGGVTGALIPTLGFGLAWNEGLLRLVDIVAPDGLVCTAQHPAHADWAQAVSAGTMATFNLGGSTSSASGSACARSILSPPGRERSRARTASMPAGPCAVPVPAIADVESNEQVSPLLYLYRRLRPDTAGAGTRRGQRRRPAARPPRRHRSEVDSAWPEAGELPMCPGDVFAVSWHGGGGWGDPISRDPQAAAEDVARGVATPEYAELVYGVVLADEAATRARRLAIRTERLGAPPTGEPDPTAPGQTLGPALRLVRNGDQVEVRTTAGAVLSRGSTRWREGAVSRPLDPAAHHIRLHEELAMTAHYCPVAGELLSVDVHRRGEPPIEELLLKV